MSEPTKEELEAAYHKVDFQILATGMPTEQELATEIEAMNEESDK